MIRVDITKKQKIVPNEVPIDEFESDSESEFPHCLLRIKQIKLKGIDQTMDHSLWYYIRDRDCLIPSKAI